MRIDEELKNYIHKPTEEELRGLEALILADGIREPLVVWAEEGILIDGHNRLAIAQRHNLPYTTIEQSFDDRTAVKLWMIDNARGRRNIPKHALIELGFERAKLLKPKAEKNMSARKGNQPGASFQESEKLEPINTVKEAADYAGVSVDTAAKYKKVTESGDTNTKAKMESGELSINAAYTKTKQAEKKKEYKERLDFVASSQVEPLTGEYDVVVIDPPWPMEKIERDVAPNQVSFDYPTMSESDLEALDIPAADDCHLWVWTTHKFLPMALRLVAKWGFKYVCTFVWHKPGGFQPFGLPQYNCEFAIYARKGAPQFIDLKAFPVCFDAPRKAHSEKPEAFYDVVRRVTGGRRIDIFNRRQIDGFDVWGNESGNT